MEMRGPPGADSALEHQNEEPIRAAREIVSRAERELREHGLEVEGRTVEGDPREALVETARKEKVDLISDPMGTRGSRSC